MERLSQKLSAKRLAHFVDDLERRVKLTHELSWGEFAEIADFHMDHHPEAAEEPEDFCCDDCLDYDCLEYD